MRNFLRVAFAAASVLAAQAAWPAANAPAGLVERASGSKATLAADGVVRIGWPRDDVPVRVDGVPLPPAAGLGSWAAFRPGPRGAILMGDTVVFQDEVDAAMDAAFAGGLEVTALHNHFFHDEPRVYFLHIAGHGDLRALAAGVKAVWDAIKQVRAAHAMPDAGPAGAGPAAGRIDSREIEAVTGLKAAVISDSVVKVSAGRHVFMHGVRSGESMGVNTWAAFVGGEEDAVIDGDFAMTAAEVTPVLKQLRARDLHIVALHNHMIGESPRIFFTHFWGRGRVSVLAGAFRAALDAQRNTGRR